MVERDSDQDAFPEDIEPARAAGAPPGRGAGRPAAQGRRPAPAKPGVKPLRAAPRARSRRRAVALGLGLLAAAGVAGGVWWHSRASRADGGGTPGLALPHAAPAASLRAPPLPMAASGEAPVPPAGSPPVAPGIEAPPPPVPAAGRDGPAADGPAVCEVDPLRPELP